MSFRPGMRGRALDRVADDVRRVLRGVDGVAQEAGRADDAAVPLALGVRLVVEDEVRVTDGAGKPADRRLVDLDGQGLRFFADDRPHLVRDKRFFSHGLSLPPYWKLAWLEDGRTDPTM